MLYMIIEEYRDGDAVPVYRRFRDRGRLAPDGLRYISSWVTSDLRRCYQVMECEDPSLLDEWISHWRDIVDFECIAVMTSAEAANTMEPRLLEENGADTERRRARTAQSPNDAAPERRSARMTQSPNDAEPE